MPSGARAPRTFLDSSQRASCASNASLPDPSLAPVHARHALPCAFCARAGSSKHSKDKTHLFKTELCKQFFLGTCTYENCTFAHDNSELRPLQKPPNYKTVLCRDFAEKGWCKRGHRCNFIHEVAPPQAPQAPPEAPPQAAFPPLPPLPPPPM